MKMNNLIKMWDLIKTDGGASYQIETGTLNPETGFMVSLSGYEYRMPVPTDINKWQDAVINYIVKGGKVGMMVDDVSLYLGAWIDGDELYLDISENIPDFETAEKLGIERKQKAIFNCVNQQTIFL